MRVMLYAVALALIAAIAIGSELRREPVYAFDGYAYGIRAQLDAGIPYPRALATARTVYAHTPAMRPAHAHRWLGAPYPQWWHLFSVRILYPWLASRLWLRYGFLSLFFISAGAYVLSVVLLYGFLTRIVRAELAALVALAIAALPPVRLYGRSDLTDMSAFAALVASLWAMTAYAREGGRARLCLALACCAALCLVRPLPYVLVCSALPLLATRERRRGAILVAATMLLCAITALALVFAHAEIPAVAFYPTALARTVETAGAWVAGHPLWIVALAALLARRREAHAAIALGALASALPTMLLDPIPSDVMRVVVFPALIPLACGLATALALVSPACRATSGARAAEHRDRNRPRLGDRPWSRTRTSVS